MAMQLKQCLGMIAEINGQLMLRPDYTRKA